MTRSQVRVPRRVLRESVCVQEFRNGPGQTLPYSLPCTAAKSVQ